MEHIGEVVLAVRLVMLLLSLRSGTVTAKYSANTSVQLVVRVEMDGWREVD